MDQKEPHVYTKEENNKKGYAGNETDYSHKLTVLNVITSF